MASLTDRMPSLAATELRGSWRKIYRRLTTASDGLVITANHDVEAVLLSVEEFERLKALALQALRQEDPELAALRAQFEQQLAVLHEPGAHERLRQVGRTPLRLTSPVTVDPPSKQ